MKTNLISILLVYCSIQIINKAKGSSLFEKIDDHLKELTEKVVNNSVVDAVKIKFTTELMVKKINDNLKSNKQFIEDQQFIVEEKCLDFLLKYKDKNFTAVEETLKAASDFILVTVKAQLSAKACTKKTFMESMVCLMKVSNSMNTVFSEQYVHLAPLEKQLNETLTIISKDYNHCLRYINTLPHIEQPYQDIDDKEIEGPSKPKLPCRITLAIVDNETGDVSGAPCYRNVTRDNQNSKRIQGFVTHEGAAT